MSQRTTGKVVATALSLILFLAAQTGGARPVMSISLPSLQQSEYVPFDGEKSTWHDGFERYDYVMDAETLAISPFKRPDGEQFGIGGPATGQRRCVVICPKHPAPGNPWSWRGCYWDHQPQTEIELVRRGFHIAYISADATLKPDKCWDAWYDFLTQKHGLSAKPTFVGMSRGGQYELRWATTHPDRVSGIYADNPAGDEDIYRGLIGLIRQDVPILFVCGTNDPLLAQNALPMEAMFQRFGGRASIILKDGAGHHPHSLPDPKPIADFLEKSAQRVDPSKPDFVGDNLFERSSYYSIADKYAWHPEDGYFLKTRGAAFSECYQQYRLFLGFETPVTIIAPNQEAPGRPWILRSSHVERDEALDLALLAKGFHIVVGPVGYNADGPAIADWNKVFGYLVSHGFSHKVVLEGEGGSAGTVYGWALANPSLVAGIVAKNPILHAAGFQNQPLDHLDILAKDGIHVLHICGDLDPELTRQEAAFERKYRELGGPITVVRDGAPTSAASTEKAVDFVSKCVSALH
jgi:pimeloyl-ACP methyl ester carboxylesterase